MNYDIRFLAQHLLHAGVTPLSDRDGRVIRRVARRIRDIHHLFEDRQTLGHRLSDRVAAVGGSWAFIGGFGAFLVVWAAFNVLVLAEHAFDPYPFVFLNLLLSMLAALQAPVIMMSQNRQAAKDRLAAALDYEVNIKSELAISEVHDKVDRLQAQVEQLVALQHAALSAGEARPVSRSELRVV